MESPVKSIVKLTLFGGVNEIGGNLVFLEDFGYNLKVIIDFGVNFEKFFEVFDNENPSTLEELMLGKLIPNKGESISKNLYSKYFIFNHKKVKYRQKLSECKDKVDPPTEIDGILISHPHRDHYYGLPLINRNIPIYTGVDTQKIILAHYNSTPLQMENFYHGLQWKLFRTGNIIEIKGMEVIPVHVDHSIPAAYGFIFKTSAGILVYSGDFRMHGPLSFMTGDLVLKTKEICESQEKKSDKNDGKTRVKALICEGTYIHKGEIESETIVKRHISTLFKNIPFDYVLVKYDRVDWDRFRTFFHIAKRFNWKYVITEKDAYFYYLLNKGAKQITMKDPNIKKEDNLFILYEGQARYPWQQIIRNMLKKHDKEWRLMEHYELKSSKGQFILYITSLSEKILDNLPLNLKGVFISSSIDPYAENFRDNSKSIEKTLKKFQIPSYRIHASGHAKPHDIYKFVKAINPQNIIPIHTQNAEFFKKLFESNEINVLLPEKDEKPFRITIKSD